MRKEQQKQKPVYQSCNIKFPERVWEPTENGWSSRPATTEDQAVRRELARRLAAVML